MSKALTAVTALAAVYAAFAVATAAPKSLARAQSTTCTAAEKDARQAALVAYRKRIAAERKAYFKKHRSAKQRAALLKRQRGRLRALETAAACTVLALPPSSSASCVFMFAPNQGTFRFSEGPLAAEWLAPRGRISAAIIFVDFPDVPASQNIEALAPTHTAHLPWFEESSYGRFALSVTPIPTWFRLPRPASSYRPLAASIHHGDLFSDAIVASDGAVDYSRYQLVFVVGAKGWTQGISSAFFASPGSGVRVDGREIRFGAVMGPAAQDRGGTFPSNVLNHEFLHTLGLPDVYGGDGTVGSWDPMGSSTSSTNHLLGWHKWLLGWLDPAQLTCLLQPGQLEETLDQLDTRGGKKLVVVPTGPSNAYAIEVRRRSGYDRTICKEGVLVYTVDSLRPSAQGPIAVKNGGGCEPAGAPFGVGGVYEDANVKVEVLATDGRAYRIRVSKK